MNIIALKDKTSDPAGDNEPKIVQPQHWSYLAYEIPLSRKAANGYTQFPIILLYSINSCFNSGNLCENERSPYWDPSEKKRFSLHRHRSRVFLLHLPL